MPPFITGDLLMKLTAREQRRVKERLISDETPPVHSVGRAASGRTVYYAVGLGYWVAPVGIAFTYIDMLMCKGKFNNKAHVAKMFYRDYTPEAFKEMIEDFLSIAEADSPLSYYKVPSEPSRLRNARDTYYQLTVPNYIRRLFPGVKNELYRKRRPGETAADVDAILRAELKTLEDRAKPLVYITLEQACTFQADNPSVEQLTE